MCFPSSISTIIVIVPAPSANISCQFIPDMEQQGGLSRNPDSKGFPQSSYAPASGSPFVSWCASGCYVRFTSGCSLAATSTTAPSLPVRCLGSISPTISDAFHGCSHQPYMNSHPLEEPPHDLHTGQLIAQHNGSKYSNISNTTFSFITCLLHCHDAGAFLGHTQLPAQSTATSSADTGVAEPKVRYMGS